jgi:hypothetical protein
VYVVYRAFIVFDQLQQVLDAPWPIPARRSTNSVPHDRFDGFEQFRLFVLWKVGIPWDGNSQTKPTRLHEEVGTSVDSLRGLHLLFESGVHLLLCSIPPDV